MPEGYIPLAGNCEFTSLPLASAEQSPHAAYANAVARR